MITHTPGDPIELSWEWSSDEDYWVVRGHVDDATAIAWARSARAERLEREGDEDLVIGSPPGPEVDPARGYVVRHQWARWEMHTTTDGPERQLALFWESGPGRFAVTVAHDGDEWHRRDVYRASIRELEARLRAEVAERWPGSEVVRVTDPIDPLVRVWFRPPGFVRDVVWVEGEGVVTVAQCDVEAWAAYLATIGGWAGAAETKRRGPCWRR